MYNFSLSHLLADHQLADHVWCQHTLPWLWLSRTKGEEGQPAEDKGHVHQDESSPDRKSSRVSFHFCFFHNQSREERRLLFGDHHLSVGCTFQLDSGRGRDPERVTTVQLGAARDPVQVTTFKLALIASPDQTRLPDFAIKHSPPETRLCAANAVQNWNWLLLKEDPTKQAQESR